jgi:putative ABC transport system permease protein
MTALAFMSGVSDGPWMRTLRRAPAFTLASVLTLAVGMGAAAAIFTVLRALVLQPLPYRDAGRLYGAGAAGRRPATNGNREIWRRREPACAE